MPLSFCVLASGSAGNSTVVICQRDGTRPTCLLIDCGLSPRMTARRLAPLGVGAEDITDILLTHFDTDHFYPGWLKVIVKRGIRLHVHRRHRAAAWRAGLTAAHVRLYDDSLCWDCGTTIHPMLLAHDDLGTVGFVIEHGGLRLGYATDLGRVPDALLDHFAGVNALAIESNYDRQMQLNSSRPWFLKRRIMGGNGHLSNDQSLEAVLRIAETSPLSHVAVLHLSRECNDPRLVRGLYEREAPDLVDRLTITSQHAATDWLQVRLTDGVRARSPRVNPGSLLHEMPLFAQRG